MDILYVVSMLVCMVVVGLLINYEVHTRNKFNLEDFGILLVLILLVVTPIVNFMLALLIVGNVVYSSGIDYWDTRNN